MTKYKKVDSDPTVSNFQEVDKVEVEEEVIAAMEEGHEKIAELEAECKLLRGAQDVVEAQNIKLKASEAESDLLREGSLRLIEELRGQVKKLTPNIPPIHPKKMGFIRDLRLRDTPKVNKTCASCSRRLPWSKMGDGKSEFCDDCLGK
jgi:hypothetical protein